MKENLMPEKINPGAILLKEGALLPEYLQLEGEPYSKGWKLLKNMNARGLDRKIRKAGWTFFSVANEVSAPAFGSDLEQTTRRAVRKVTPQKKPDSLNCQEITH